MRTTVVGSSGPAQPSLSAWTYWRRYDDKVILHRRHITCTWLHCLHPCAVWLFSSNHNLAILCSRGSMKSALVCQNQHCRHPFLLSELTSASCKSQSDFKSAIPRPDYAQLHTNASTDWMSPEGPQDFTQPGDPVATTLNPQRMKEMVKMKSLNHPQLVLLLTRYTGVQQLHHHQHQLLIHLKVTFVIYSLVFCTKQWQCAVYWTSLDKSQSSL